MCVCKYIFNKDKYFSIKEIEKYIQIGKLKIQHIENRIADGSINHFKDSVQRKF